MTSVQHWTGREARVLRVALRMSVRAFAGKLGIAQRTVSRWEALGVGTVPRPHMQAVLDTTLGQADHDARLRFEQLLSELTDALGLKRHHDGPRAWEYETWVDDLDRALVSLSRQEFDFAAGLLDRWLARFDLPDLDARGAYLYGRTLTLQGDVQQDQGQITGPASAQQTYQRARQVFASLDIPRRVAKAELSLAVVDEMAGRLAPAARQYERLATDERLSDRDRTRAHLWIGTALSKAGRNADAIQCITPSIEAFDRLGEPLDWSIAHQKLALARRGAGDLSGAVRAIDVALSNRAEVPMQQVRLSTAHAHILLTDPATAAEGLLVLDSAGQLAQQYHLMHQYQSIQAIRRDFEIAHAGS
jgi:tetratricopeptide (TPR) repeat protein